MHPCKKVSIYTQNHGSKVVIHLRAGATTTFR